MAFNIVQSADGSIELLETPSGASGAGTAEVRFRFAGGAVIAFGVSQADNDESYIAMTTADGTTSYLTISNANAVAAAGTRP